ncbi:hypothetical protein [Saccharibacillus kuerlensis]|uniref:ABC transporter permease n=1 Tax=Saccharibacillus kuerlensis TaxID=459527 RepID=A0ABQ2KSC4_9BACL|nr:hypothetical protein [Saccharibacillus kuerlensis]GGN91882.1 hypothetical protein GCM10010969_03820 [Saccharibacillus kuerlensis]
MLRLLKYDLKRDMYVLLGGTIALLLGLLVIELGTKSITTSVTAKAVLSFMMYTFFGILILIATCRGFQANICSIGRRLVPLGSIHYIGAALLYGVLLNAVLLAIAGLQVLYYDSVGILEELWRLGAFTVNWNSSIPLPLGALLIILWATLFLLTLLLLVMALTESIKFKGRILIALAVIVLLSSLISWAENHFFGGLSSQALTGFRIEDQSQMILPSQSFRTGLLRFIFKLVVGAVFIWLTVKLIDNRVKVD